MNKGKMLSLRDVEVLDAFLIKSVAIEPPSTPMKSEPLNSSIVDINKQSESVLEVGEEATPSNKVNQLAEYQITQAWSQMMKLLKNVFYTVSASKLPVLELRQNMDLLLKYTDHYRPLAVSSHFLDNSFDQIDDNYVFKKSIAVALTSYLIGQWSGYATKEGMQIALAGLLHDIGRMKVDEDIWNKQGALTDRERVEMKRHTQYGYEMLRQVPAINEGVKLAALQHHERIDGSGYPLGVKGDKIHSYAKIVAIADIFHAMTMNRGYKKAVSPYTVLEQLQEDAFGKLDPQLVQTFIRKVTQLHQGMLVRLSDGRTGRIVFTEDSHPTRPWVAVDNGDIIRLVQERQLWIESVL
ncbi:HD-GYP domain-containing protein [Paenibacillus sp. 481]|uniref:HD-GYP domain-containing protein n=1 Tax=Paenibacillus sp. 481 TaxID=2835869 RepID=UPI002FC3B4E2